MKRLTLAAAVGSALLMMGTSAMAQVVPGGQDNSDWPANQWGPEDRAGSANHTKNSANIKKALSLVKQ